MRTQAFGVEIETKGLGPEQAAQAIAQALGTAPRGSRVADRRGRQADPTPIGSQLREWRPAPIDPTPPDVR